MSGYLNRVQLIGNLGRDPDLSRRQAGRRSRSCCRHS
jgi:single-stranded DNA-binding protein